MNGVLGGFKNMLRQWRINLKTKKNKKTAKKISIKSCIVSLIYISITIFYRFFGRIFNRSDYNDNLYKTLEEISVSLDKIIINNKSSKEYLKIKKRLIHTEKEIKSLMNNKFRNKLSEIKTKIDFIDNSNKEISTKQNVSEKTKNIQSNALSFKLDIDETQKENIIETTNKKILNITAKLEKIEHKIPKIKEYNYCYDVENNLRFLYNKIKLLKNEYQKIKKELNIKIDLNKYELLSEEKIAEIMLQIDDDLKLIDLKKKEILKRKKIKKEEKKEQPKEQTLKKTDQQKIKQVNEFVLAQNIILNNVINQDKHLENYLKKVSQSINKKKTIISSLSHFSNYIFKFTFSLLPISIFKNKLLGMLVSSIMINNFIKTMRKMIEPKTPVNYELFLENYMSYKDIIVNTYNICVNSLNELDFLKDGLQLFKGKNEINTILEQIELIENRILNQIEKLKLKDKTLEKTYVKLKKVV